MAKSAKMRLFRFCFCFLLFSQNMKQTKKAQSNKIGRFCKHVRKPENPTKFSIYHNILHKYTFHYCINIQKLAYKTRD